MNFSVQQLLILFVQKHLAGNGETIRRGSLYTDRTYAELETLGYIDSADGVEYKITVAGLVFARQIFPTLFWAGENKVEPVFLFAGLPPLAEAPVSLNLSFDIADYDPGRWAKPLEVMELQGDRYFVGLCVFHYSRLRELEVAINEYLRRGGNNSAVQSYLNYERSTAEWLNDAKPILPGWASVLLGVLP